MTKTLLVAAAVATVLCLGDSAIAYWNGPAMAPPPIPQPPGGIPGRPGAGWGMGYGAYPAARGRYAAALESRTTYQTAQGTQGGPTAVREPEPQRVAQEQALQALRAERVRLLAKCAQAEPATGPAEAADGGSSAEREAEEVKRLSAELAQVRAELVASTRRVHDLIAERDELKLQFGSNMGDVASVRNTFRQVRKRAVEVGTALSDTQGTDVGGGLEREFLKADLDRLIAALALADAVLSDAASVSQGSQGGAGAGRSRDWSGGASEADMVEAASFEKGR